MEVDDSQYAPSDALALQKSAGNDDFIMGVESSEVADHGKINNADEASWFSAGVLRTPLLASQGSQQSKTVSQLSAGNSGQGSLSLWHFDALLACFVKPNASVLMDRAGLSGDSCCLMCIVEASRKSAGTSLISRASSFAALDASWLAAGPAAPSHLRPTLIMVHRCF